MNFKSIFKIYFMFSIFFGILFSNYFKKENISNRLCDDGFIEINELCFYNDDIEVLQSFIDNSYSSGIDLGCDDYGGWYCGSPNPQMDSIEDAWYWNTVDSTTYLFANGNGIVEPLELGIQEWENGRLESIMCGAYIYCELSFSRIPCITSTIFKASCSIVTTRSSTLPRKYL